MTRSAFFLAVAVLVVQSAPAQQQTPRDPFPAWDKNGDGRLSPEELPERVRANFRRVDKDGDGFISREEHREFVARRQPPRDPQRGPQVPPGVEVRKDLDYVGDGNPRQMLDVLLPRERGRDAKLPLVVFIHGGAWRNGSKAAGMARLAPLVASGDFAGATINYRLSGEATWPAQIHDCKAALRYLRGRAGDFGIDPKKIAVMGSSAGGHLVSILGTSGGVKQLEGDLGAFDDQDSGVSCVVNYFGPQDFLTMVRQESTINRRGGGDYPEALLLGGPVEDKKDLAKEASPVTWVSEDDPPFLTAHGTKDPLVPYAQAEEIHAALGKAGVESHLIRMEGAGHGFGSPELDRRVRAFLDKHLRGRDAEISDEPIAPEAPRRRAPQAEP